MTQQQQRRWRCSSSGSSKHAGGELGLRLHIAQQQGRPLTRRTTATRASSEAFWHCCCCCCCSAPATRGVRCPQRPVAAAPHHACDAVVLHHLRQRLIVNVHLEELHLATAGGTCAARGRQATGAGSERQRKHGCANDCTDKRLSRFGCAHGQQCEPVPTYLTPQPRRETMPTWLRQ